MEYDDYASNSTSRVRIIEVYIPKDQGENLAEKVVNSSTAPTVRLSLAYHNYRLAPPQIPRTHDSLHPPFPTTRYANGRRRAVLRRATTIDSASTVVTKFYDGINRRDLAVVEEFIDQNCVYEDLIFPKPFVGRKAILEFFDKFVNSISSDLQFAIDDISEEDASAVGVAWHLEWKGKVFPFSKGCSFYRLDVINGQRQIV
ncbi:hypothetical protein F511_05987 [Dorcoceras hygrometricum]|uniref:SnoaL-like domain-containing protein n=1 Tax=Dorcoceras hygrometricum TaxID=472368 RepID=A0A2Z7DHG9_9LAMI|nr:hypothetical protein F511_05987 [Dorcoceras hygrometricum]